MAVTVGYYWSGAIAIGIPFIGTRFLVVPHATAAGLGVAAKPDTALGRLPFREESHDIASGLFTAILILNRSPHLLGWFMLAATTIPLGDVIVVLGHGGRRLRPLASMA